jgi:tetratricopeptide (TPR) repeat protein
LLVKAEGSMELSARLSLLESVHDWQSLLEELERAIANTSDAEAKAGLHLQIGRVLDERFLQGVKALKHFQDAFKLNPALLEALERARGIYWELGKTAMVQKLLDIELRSAQGAEAVPLLLEQADVLCDGGDYERAAATYAKALGASEGTSDDARAGLEDTQLGEESWQAFVATLVQEAEEQTGSAASRSFLRAARIARRFGASSAEELFARAYDSSPLERQVAAVYEGLLVASERGADLVELQREFLERQSAKARAVASFRFGSRWATRHQQLETAATFFEESLSLDPTKDSALHFLKELYGVRDGNWDQALGLIEKAANSTAPSAFALATAGLTAWKQQGNLLRARVWFEKLAQLTPDHPAIPLFELQIGESVRGVPTTEADEVDLNVGELQSSEDMAASIEETSVVAPEELAEAIEPAAEADVVEAPVDVPSDVADEVLADDAAPTAGMEAEPPVEPEVTAPTASEQAAPVTPSVAAAVEPVVAPAPRSPEKTAQASDPAKVQELRQKLEKLQAAKRMTEYVKTLVELADCLDDPNEKVAAYLEAAELYTTKFPNAAEAVKCFEAVLAIDENNELAIEHLRATYEKRKDWEKLIRLMRREASVLEVGFDRSAKFAEIARLATERVKKPDVCIELWEEVLAGDPDNVEALNSLPGLYERNKEYGKLADVLERQVEITSDAQTQEATYKKLGQLYGERLGDDAKAVEAWRKLLALNPNDRSAQEALKKKYLALGMWDDLEVFYADSGKWDEFIRLLEAQEAKETEDAAKIGLLVKTAQLWVTQKGKLDRAARAYEKVLSLDPKHLGAAEALIPIYQQANNAKGLASAIEVKLSHDVDGEEKLLLLREVAGLYEGKLKEPERAFERYLAAFESAPTDERCVEDVERAAGVTKSWEALVGAYHRAIERASEDAERIGLRLRLGRVLTEETGEVEKALEQFRAVHEADPENTDAISALERLYRQTLNHAELLGIYEKKRDLASEPEARHSILASIAQLHVSELKNPRAGIDTYRQLLEENPQDPIALAALDGLYKDLEDWENYAEVLRARLELDNTEEQIVDLKYRLGSALEKHLGDPAGALANYREILFVDPANEPARAALETLLEHPELRAETASILQEIYESRGDWAKLIGSLEILAAAEEDQGRRVGLLRKVARVAAQNLQDLPAAIEAQARALRADPSDGDTLAELEQFAEQATAWDDLERILSEVAEGLADPALARAYWMRLASIDERLNKVDVAAERYLRVLTIDAADGEALAAMDALYRRTERWEDLIGVYRRRIDLAEAPQDREGLYSQMASVYEDKLGRPEDAIAAYRGVLELEPTSVVALTALDGLYTRQGRWVDLAENLEAHLQLAESDEEQTRLMLRLGDLRETRMGQVETSIDIYREVLERDPANEAALGALERLGQSPDHELPISEILEPLYRQSGDWQRLIGVYEVQVRRSEDPTRRVELLHQIASLYEDSGNLADQAFQSLSRALAEDPTSEDTKGSLERIARAEGWYAELAKVFEDRAASALVGGDPNAADEATAIGDPAVAVDLFTMAARIYENDLAAAEPAVLHYRKVLEIDPANLAAAESLERMFRGGEQYPELSAVLQHKAEILESMSDKKGALFQAASIEEDVLDRPDAAVVCYRKILELDAEDVRAVDALIKVHSARGEWASLLAAYVQKADLVNDPGEKKSIFYQIGAVHERELKDVPQAIDTYNRILEIDPADLAALARLDALYQSSENWAELLTVLQNQSELAADAEESIRYQYRIAELYEKRLADAPRAIELYRELLSQMPDHEPTLTALEGIKDSGKDAHAAALVLEPVYDAAGDWARLVSVLEVQVKHTEDVFGQVDLLHRIARLDEEMIGDHRAAFEVYARAVALDVTNEESLASFERLAMAVGSWPQVAQLYDAELSRLKSEQPERFVDLALRLAQIFETQLEDVDNAIGRYRAVVEVDSENWTAITSLDRLLVMVERWRELVPVLAREAEIGPTPDDILNFKFRLGQVHETRLADVPAAIQAYREVIAAAPEHAPTLEALEGLFAQGVHQLEIGEVLEPLYQSTGDWDKLTAVFEAELGQKTGREERLATYFRIAELHEERLISLDGALAVYIRSLKEFPSDEKTLDECERLGAASDGGWEALANAYADVLELHEDKPVQAAIGKRLARLFEEELGDISNAEKTYRYVLGIDPADVPALTELDRIYTSLEQWPELAQVIEQRIPATTDPMELTELHLRVGEVYEERLQDESGVGQLDDATRVFRRVFDELDPANENAINALERIYSQREQWPELKMVLDRQLEHASGDSAEADIRAKLANVLADKLNEPAKATDAWKRVLDLRGDDPEALHGLANLHERLGEWSELTEVLGRHFDIAEDDADRVSVLLRRARLFEGQLSRDDEALDDYHRVLDIEGDNLDALYAIAAIWRRRNDPAQLVETLDLTILRATEKLPPEHQIALFRELALTHQNVLGQSYEAVDAWRRLLAVDPRDFEAMSNLENLLRAEDRWEEVIEVKMGRAKALPTPEEQIREYLEVAALWEGAVQKADAATPAYEAVLALDPAHDQAFKALEKLHAAARRDEALIELFLARLDTRDETHEKTELLRKVAKVFDEGLEDKPQAFDALLTAFEMDVDDNETTKALEKVTQSTNKWPELVQQVNQWLTGEQVPSRKITLCLRLAKWYEDLNRPEYAQPYYAQVHKLDPNNVAVLRQMANFLKRSGNFQQQGQMLQQALANAVSDTDRKEILTEMGEVLHLKMNETEQGLSFYRRALEVDPHYVPALEQLEKHAVERGNNAELVDILSAKAKGLAEPDQVAATKLRVGGIYESTLGHPDKAAQAYREVLDADASNVLAMRGLERVHQQMQQWPELVSVLEMQLDVVATERERIEVLMKIAKIQEELFVKPDAAALRLEQVVEIDPNFEPALEGLARCYRQRRQWLDLNNTYDRHVNATSDRLKKVELWSAQAIVYSDELEDIDRAIDSYNNIVELDPQHIPALDALAKLYEKQGETDRAIEHMTRVADLTTDGRQKVEMYHRIGRQLDEKLGDRMAAQENYERALDLDGSHQPTLAALRTIAVDAADWDRAARYLDSEQLVTESPRLRAKLLVELGKMRQEMLGEQEQAMLAYELALQCDSDNEDAALPLMQEYASRSEWERAEPLAELLVKKAGKRDRHEQHSLQNSYGKILAARKNFPGALKAFQAAAQLDLTNQETIRGLAEVCFELQDWAGALTNYQKVLTSLEEHDTEQRAFVYFRLGAIKQAQGQPKQAISNFDKALQVEPSHQPTLEALVALYEGAKDWVQVCHYKRIILDNVYDGDVRFKTLVEIGDIWGDSGRGKSPNKAIEAYDEALGLRADDHVVLHKLLQVCTDAQQWERMNETLEAIAKLEPNKIKQSKYFFTIAQIWRDKLSDPDRAVEYFDQALELNPASLDAFERINKILTSQKNWNGLERAYRKMLHRLAQYPSAELGGQQKADVEFNLWHALGLIFRDRLKDPTQALGAFRKASSFRPEDKTEHTILSELYEESGQIDLAIAEYQALVRLDPVDVGPYRRLYALYLTKQSYDEAWCLAATLTFLKKAGDDERQFFEDYRPQALPQVTSRVDNNSWLKRVFPTDENPRVGKIFEFIAPAAVRGRLEQMKAKNEIPVLDARFRQDPATSTVTFARTFGWAANVLGLPVPQLYVRSDVPGALSHVPVDPPSSLAGQTVLSRLTPQDLVFIVGKHVAYYRGEHYIRAIFQTVTELTVLFFAGIKLVAPEQPTPPDLSKQIIETARSLAVYMQPVQLEGLKLAVRDFIQTDDAKANIKRWAQCAEIACMRAGFLLSGDLDTALKVISAEQQMPGDLTPQEKLKELLVFSVSEDYFKLRAQLGLAIKVAAQ